MVAIPWAPITQLRRAQPAVVTGASRLLISAHTQGYATLPGRS